MQPDGTYKKMKVFDTYVESIVHDTRILNSVLRIHPELLNKQNPQTGRSPLFRVAGMENSFKSLILLFTFGADINMQDYNGDTPITYAIRHEYNNAILLLAYGANPQHQFTFHSVEYKGILDFLHNSPYSKNEDIEFEKNYPQKNLILSRYLIKMKAKETLIRILEQSKK
jgi:hypothetical protein